MLQSVGYVIFREINNYAIIYVIISLPNSNFFSGATSSVSSSEVTDTSSDDMNEIDMMPDSSLSSTRFGQMMKYQARRRANTTCCLDLGEKILEILKRNSF